jgi:RNA polymerase sigma-70 factor (ECF subfamily)
MTARHHRFEALVGALLPDLYRYALWLCRDRAKADDIVQETLLRAWRSLDQLREERAAKRWLITILRRELARSYERVTPDFADADVADLPIADERPGVEHDAELELVRREMFKLEPEYREPLVLQVLMGYAVEEIAEVMELNVATVLTRLFRARKKLAARLGDGAPRFEAETA